MHGVAKPGAAPYIAYSPSASTAPATSLGILSLKMPSAMPWQSKVEFVAPEWSHGFVVACHERRMLHTRWIVDNPASITVRTSSDSSQLSFLGPVVPSSLAVRSTVMTCPSGLNRSSGTYKSSICMRRVVFGDWSRIMSISVVAFAPSVTVLSPPGLSRAERATRQWCACGAGIPPFEHDN